MALRRETDTVYVPFFAVVCESMMLRGEGEGLSLMSA